MNKLMILSISALLFCVSLFAQSNEDTETEKAAIKKVIQDAYADGFANNGDIEAMNKGFHPGFAILGINNNSLWIYPIYRWTETVKHKKKEGKYPPNISNQWSNPRSSSRRLILIPSRASRRSRYS